MNNKSFSLIETIIAMVVMGVIIVAFIASVMVSFNYMRRIVELRTANLLIQEQISMVRNLDFSEIESLDGTFFSSSIPLLNDATGSITESTYDGNSEILKVTFRLDWTTFNGNPAYKTVATLITDHGINKR